VDLANTTFTKRNEAAKKLLMIEESALQQSSGISVPLGIIVDSIDRICDYGCNLAEIAINSAISEP
jgi:hypothetical protein